MDIEMLENLLNIADHYFTEYCELKDEYVLSDKELENIEDEEEREYAEALRNTDDYFKKVAKYIEEYKEKNKSQGNDEEEEI